MKGGYMKQAAKKDCVHLYFRFGQFLIFCCFLHLRSLLTSLCASITPLHPQIGYLKEECQKKGKSMVFYQTPLGPTHPRYSREIFLNVFVQILETLWQCLKQPPPFSSITSVTHSPFYKLELSKLLLYFLFVKLKLIT